MKYALKRDIYTHVAKWLDILAEHISRVEYKNGTPNKAAAFLSRTVHDEEVKLLNEGNLVRFLKRKPTGAEYSKDLQQDL